MAHIVSQAQNRFMRACAGQNAMDGCPSPKVVEEFIGSVHGTHKVKVMPQHVRDGKPVRGRFPKSQKTLLPMD